MAIGRVIFQPIRITWSYLKRGRVHLTQIIKNSINAIFTINVSSESRTEIQPHACGHSKPGNGFHPPRNNTINSDAPATMCPYSPTKNRPNLNEPYSVWYPLTRSVSLSAISKGSLFVSANRQMRNISAETGWVRQNHQFPDW